MDDLLASQVLLESVARELVAGDLSGDDTVALLERVGVHRRLIDGILGQLAKRAEDTAAYTYKGDRNAPELCARLVGVSSGEAKRAIETAAKLESLPATDAAMRAGSLSARAAEVIATTAVDDPSVEGSLLKVAAGGSHVELVDRCVEVRAEREDQAARAVRQHKNRSFRMWKTSDGMMEGHFKVTPEVGGAIKAVIDEGTRTKFRDARSAQTPEDQDRYAADAFATAVAGDPTKAKSGGHTVHVLVDHQVLARGHALPGETCEIPGVGPVNAQWVREILGSAFVTAIIKKGKDITTVAHLGRHIPVEVRTAMVVSGRECSIQGCTGREYLELDHCEIDYGKKGPTAFWNLAWLCSIHHARKTKGWILGPPDPDTGKRRLDPPGSADRGRAA